MLVGLDEIKALDGQVEPGGGSAAHALTRFPVGQLEVARKDRPAFEVNGLDRRQCGLAPPSFKVLGNEALRILRNSRTRRARKQKRNYVVAKRYGSCPLQQ